MASPYTAKRLVLAKRVFRSVSRRIQGRVTHGESYEKIAFGRSEVVIVSDPRVIIGTGDVFRYSFALNGEIINFGYAKVGAFRDGSGTREIVYKFEPRDPEGFNFSHD